MPVDPKQADEVKAAAVHVEDLRVENRGGSEIVVLETGDGTQYTNFKDKLEAEYENRDKYIGGDWLIQFTTQDRGSKTYRNLIGFEEELDALNSSAETGESERDDGITRQSAAHDASRIVQGALAGGYYKKTSTSREEVFEEAKEDVKELTEFFKQHHRTGEWE